MFSKINNHISSPNLLHHVHSLGPCGCKDMQMLHSFSENSTVISTNAVRKQTMGARDCSGFPIVISSDCDSDVDTAMGDRRRVGKEGRGAWME